MKVHTFWNLMPINYFLGEYEKQDAREVELDAEFKIVFQQEIGKKHLKNSITLSQEEQNILDAEIATMQFGFEGSTVRHLMAFQLDRSQTYIEKALDKIEAKYHLRNIIGASLPPPRHYPNICFSYWQSFFGMSF